MTVCGVNVLCPFIKAQNTSLCLMQPPAATHVCVPNVTKSMTDQISMTMLVNLHPRPWTKVQNLSPWTLAYIGRWSHKPD